MWQSPVLTIVREQPESTSAVYGVSLVWTRVTGSISFLVCQERRLMPSRLCTCFPSSLKLYILLCCNGNSAHTLLVFCSHNLSLCGPDHCSCSILFLCKVPTWEKLWYGFGSLARPQQWIALVLNRQSQQHEPRLVAVPGSYSPSWMMLGEAVWHCGIPHTNEHVIQCLGSSYPTSRARRCKSAKNWSTALFCLNCHTVNWSNALNALQ